MELKLLRVGNHDLPLPSYATDGAAGMDLRTTSPAMTMHHGDTAIFHTGFAAEVPEGFELQIRSRSGLAAKHGIFVTNGIGTIDSDYRGELMVILSKLGRTPTTIEPGERIAQAVLVPVTRAAPVEVSSLSESGRGEGRFGSTGRM